MTHSTITASEQALLRAAQSLTTRLSVEQTCESMLTAMEEIFAARSSWITLQDPSTRELVTVAFRGTGADCYAGCRFPAGAGLMGIAMSSRRSFFVPDVKAEPRWANPERMYGSGLRSVFLVPMIFEDKPVGIVGLDSPRFTSETPPTAADIARLEGIAAYAAIGIRNARLFEAVQQDRERLRRLLQERRSLRSEVHQLREEVRDTHLAGDIVGESAALRAVLEQVSFVAPADSTVLIVGETGTGKELLARVIHARSRRSVNPFVALNCAALPESLVESELFGHEKGAFTGALGRKPGRFELADRGTLFLDEIGDLPLQAQAKLLRVLQEREVQRVGGTRAVPVNVRVIAATNQALDVAMAQGRFRQDLYYRVNVFPIQVPPLRDRRDDIVPLTSHFTRRFSERLHKPVAGVADQAIERLIAYDWPGNVRELQNVIERAVILARGRYITADFINLVAVPVRPPSPPPVVTPRASGEGVLVPFSEAERQAILRALESTGWRISGRGGAADVLGLKPTTLHAKMKKLGIRRPAAPAIPAHEDGSAARA